MGIYLEGNNCKIKEGCKDLESRADIVAFLKKFSTQYELHRKNSLKKHFRNE